MTVEGTCDPRFSELTRLLEKSIEVGADLGASVAVCLDGKTVVDIWGGWTSEDKTKPWQSDTLVNTFSNTKNMTTLAALVLVDRGELDIFAPVSRYWPEFAANGKKDVQVRHLLSHTSGVAGWDVPVELTDIYDPRRSVEMLAAQAPWWEPGTAAGYHGMSFGHLVHEIIRRITGQSLGRFFAQEIAGPLGADYHIGLAPEHDERLTFVVPPPPTPFDMDSVDQSSPAFKFMIGPPIPPTTSWTEAWRRSELGGGGNGQGNARSVAQIQAVVSHGGEFGGVKLLSQKTCDLIFQEQANGVDLVLGVPMRWGVGYALSNPEAFPYLPAGRVCFWAGFGGSMTVNDLDRRMTFSYIMNKMEPGELGAYRGIVGGDRSEALLRAAYAALNVTLPSTPPERR